MSDEGKLIIPVLWDKISGDSTLREIKREEEVEHERQLAMIRAESHALVWYGTTEELVTTITRWYENGWIIADGVQSALEKASVHFRKPDGAPVIKTFIPPRVHTGTFSASASYQKVTFGGKEYNLAQHRHAPAVLKALHESLTKGESGLTTTQIRERAKLPRNGGKMYDWFRGTGLWKTLVVSVGRDRYRLDVSTEA